MLMHVRMMFARTRPNVGTHMDRISAFVKMDGRVTPVIKVKLTFFFSCYVHIMHEKDSNDRKYMYAVSLICWKAIFFFKGLVIL